MIWLLIRRDEVWRWMPWLVVVSGLMMALYVRPSGDSVMDLGVLIVTYGFFSMALLGVLFFQHRDVYFQASLPITVRQIYVSRVPPMIVLLWIPIIVGMVTGMALSRHAAIPALLDAGSVFTAVILLVQSTAIRCRLGKAGSYAFHLFLLAGLVVAYAASGLPGWLLRHGLVSMAAIPLVSWLASGAIVLWTLQSLPAGFDFAPKMLPAPVPIRVTPGNKRGRVAQLRVVLVDFYCLNRAGVVCYFIAGILMASKWPNAFWATFYFLLALAWVSIRAHIRWLTAFPVSRRGQLAAILLQTLLVVSAGYEAGLRIPAIADRTARGIMVTASAETELHGLSKECKMFSVLPPLEYRVRGEEGHVPVFRAPWGETFQPGINSFDGFGVYNPFASDCDNSERFLDWQFARATAAVYGRSFPRDRAAGAYVVASPLGMPQVRMQLVTIGVTGVALMLLLGADMLGDFQRLHRWGKVTQRIVTIPAIFPGLILLIASGDVSQWAYWALPANGFAAFGAAMLVLGAIYWALDAMFGQLEFLDKPVRKRR